MSWDLRSQYRFDATEGQIPEGQISVYGPANSHANCIPASFTAALNLAGGPDIDPQRMTNEVFGPAYRGGTGKFTWAIEWIKANVPSAPAISDGAFDFAAADAAGAAGQLIVIAGWIDAASVTFVPGPTTFSHASLLVAHLANDQFVIWNTWTGQLQTYSRSTLAASLYEMAIFSGLFSGGSGSLTGDDMYSDNDREMTTRVWLALGAPGSQDLAKALAAHLDNDREILTRLFYVAGSPGSQDAAKAAPLATVSALGAAIKAIPAPTGTTDLAPVLAAVKDLKDHPAVIADPTLAAAIAVVNAHFTGK